MPERLSEQAPEGLRLSCNEFEPPLKTPQGLLLLATKSDDILHENIRAMQKEMLQTITLNGVDLDSLYGQTLEMMREQKGDVAGLGMKVLMWVSHAGRPLRINELCHALAVDPEASHLYTKDIPSQEAVLESCLGLVMVEKGTLRVRLIHDTLQQYLSQPGILLGAHGRLGETCIAFLNNGQVKGIRDRKIRDLVHMPFLEYASLYWASHAKVELSDTAKALAPDLFQNFENHISFSFFFKKYYPYDRVDSGHPLTALHLASFLGIESLVAALIKVKSSDINKKDGSGHTPLFRAVDCRHHGVARLLLTCDGVDPDRESFYSTPLIWAIKYGDDEMIRLLIKGGCDPTKPNKDGEIPLIVASGRSDSRRLAALLQPPPITISDLD